MGVVIRCKECGFHLGKFRAINDNGGVIMVCPRCDHDVEIFSVALTKAEENGKFTIIANAVIG